MYETTKLILGKFAKGLKCQYEFIFFIFAVRISTEPYTYSLHFMHQSIPPVPISPPPRLIPGQWHFFKRIWQIPRGGGTSHPNAPSWERRLHFSWFSFYFSLHVCWMRNAYYFNVFIALVVFDFSIADVAQMVAFKHWRNTRIKKTCL